MDTLDAIRALVAKFDQNKDSYLRSTYNEAQVRTEFIDPLFEALGWDVANRQGFAEAYKEVIHEDAVKIGSATNAPDYSFRIGGARKFFVEAKKPSVGIHDDPSPAFQLRRYAWSAKLTAPEQTVLTRRIETTGTRIDRLVCGLYGLTDEEMRLVEEEPQA
jgi:hypothetical protein